MAMSASYYGSGDYSTMSTKITFKPGNSSTVHASSITNINNSSGAWLSYEGTKFQGRDNAKQMIEDNPELAEELETKIFEAMKNGSPKKR